MTDNLILYELQKTHEAPTNTKEEHTLIFRMIISTEKFYISEPIIKTSKINLIRLSVYKSVFNKNRRNNHFLYHCSCSNSNSNSSSDINKAILTFYQMHMN